MAKVWNLEHPIPWICDEDKQDFFAQIGDYTLRVEQMDKNRWWWRVYYQGNPIPTKLDEFSAQKYRAIGLAEGLYLGHLAANKETVINFIIHKARQDNEQ